MKQTWKERITVHYGSGIGMRRNKNMLHRETVHHVEYVINAEFYLTWHRVQPSKKGVNFFYVVKYFSVVSITFRFTSLVFGQ